jgi:hypothetical protein
MAQVPPLVRRLYEIVNELETIFPGRSFTPDGHLVGSIGESLAAYIFDLELMVASNTAFDARTSDGLTVEIKATQGASVALSGNAEPLPDRLVVLLLPRSGLGEVVYNGPAAQAWNLAGPIQKNGQRRISLSSLRRMTVLDTERLTVVRQLPIAAETTTVGDGLGQSDLN